MKDSVKYSARHLVVLVDGTWVSSSNLDAKHGYSNVYWLNLYLDTHTKNNEAQIAFYLPGLGSLQSGTKKVVQGVLAEELPQDVEKAYINICSNYMDANEESVGDKIYLFGFSRGAVIARLVASLICEYGLLHASKVQHFRLLWNRYVGTSDLSDEEFDKFRRQNCHDAKIEFLGAFDTVFGTYGGSDDTVLKSHFFKNRALPKKIKNACHILALDETRSAFKPVLWNAEDPLSKRLEQVWMPGVHSDVGGGYQRDALSRIALHWMLSKIRTCTRLEINQEMLDGLEDRIRTDIEGDNIEIHDERGKWIWFKQRAMYLSQRVCDADDSHQYLHPICKVLEGRAITYKSNEKREPRTLYQFDLQHAQHSLFADLIDRPPAR
jgi:uncharacterized protein (DUF2235 family)